AYPLRLRVSIGLGAGRRLERVGVRRQWWGRHGNGPGFPVGAWRPRDGRGPSPREFVAAVELKDIHFAFDRAEIGSEAATVLDTNAQWLKANPNHLVLIEGHADERGTSEYNLALGDRRAKASMNYLIAHGDRR